MKVTREMVDALRIQYADRVCEYVFTLMLNFETQEQVIVARTQFAHSGAMLDYWTGRRWEPLPASLAFKLGPVL